MFAILENVRSFGSSRPPLVLFMICLLSFVVVLFSVAYIIKVQDYQNPDIKKDWNTFLQKIAEVDFCIQENITDNIVESPRIKDVVSKLHETLQGGSSDLITPDSTAKFDPNQLVTVSVPLYVEVMPTVEFLNSPHTVTHLTTSMSSEDIGMEASSGPASELNVTFALHYNWTGLCKVKEQCEKVIIQTCVSFQAPARLFPRTRRPDICPLQNETGGVEYHAKMISMKKDFGQKVICGQSPSLQVKYKLDPKLVVMLTLEDRSLINLHLLHTSYFLFVMVITLLCYAIIRGKPKSKSLHSSELQKA